MAFNFLFDKIYDPNPPALALDLSDLSLKFVQLDRGWKKDVVVKYFGEQKLPAGLIENGQIKKKPELIAVIKDVFKNGGLRSNFIVCNLPEQQTFVKLVKMPKTSEKEIKSAVGWQMEEVIPLKLDEVYYDSEILNYSENNIDHTDVLVGAVKKELADDYVSVLRGAGFEPKRLEPESIAISRAVVKDGESKKPVMIIDWGATQITFIIYSGGAPRFTNSIQLEESNFPTAAIAKKFNVGLDEAESMKIEIGLNKHIKISKYIIEAIEPILKNLVDQIRKNIDYYDIYAHEHMKEYKISEVILVGGESNLYGLTNYVSSQTGLKVHRANPLIKILKSPFSQLNQMPHPVSLRYTTAIGLALPEVID